MAVAVKITPKDAGIPDSTADDVVAGLLTTAYFIGGVAAVIVIIIAGLQYVIADADSAKVKKAKNAIIYAVVGLVIVLSAFVITSFIAGRF